MNGPVKIILPQLEHASAPDLDLSVPSTLEQTHRELLETDRSSTIRLTELFDRERQASTTFRFVFNIDYLYDNSIKGIVGTNGYAPFLNNLYYDNPTFNAPWYSGYPQMQEFDLIREDVDNTHIKFITKSATTYNWAYYLTYPGNNNYTRKMHCVYGGQIFDWTVSGGIPVVISRVIMDGMAMIRFHTPMPHGLAPEEFVKLSGLVNQNEFVFPVISGTDIYKVHSLGTGQYGTDDVVFNVLDVGYPLTLFSNNAGLIKRVTDPDNEAETTSIYYVREHKVLTNLDDLVLTYTGFQKNNFKEDRKYEYSALTPNNQERVSIRNRTVSYNVTNALDIDVEGLMDNNGRPVSNIFLTFVNRGFMGWFHRPPIHLPPSSPITPPALKIGWEFNVNTPGSDPWWNTGNPDSNTNIPTTWYSKDTNNDQIPDKFFFHNIPPKKGDVLTGDMCEYNSYWQSERVISSAYHKMAFNFNLFDTNIHGGTMSNPPGYFYKIHHPCKIREYSSYVETGSDNSSTYVDLSSGVLNLATVDIPDHAFYSDHDGEWRWRDIYTHGYIDPDDNGTDFPFLNKAHHPFTKLTFRLIADSGLKYPINDIIEQPLTDECE